ncbi:MAG: VWA domain-containing protein [Planctomycetaceae bacterium]|nr:VWA domain-containing protein [Planctomycetaceae bacterium]
MIPVIIEQVAPEVMIESIFTKELPQEEITRELDLETTPSDSLNVIAGGTPSTAVGAAAQPVATPVNVQQANVMREADIRPVLTDVSLPTDNMIGTELGEGEISGEVGAMVEGYGAAMGVITQELVRMMRQQKVTVIWLFDESGSLVDDRKEIRENYIRVYEELGIAASQDEDLRKGSELLLTVVCGYGATIHKLTPRPTSDIEQIKTAIDRVPIDESGTENMCDSITKVINEYKPTALRGKRKLAVIVVTDESGDDGQYVEDAVTAARAAKAPVYFMGRESMFGYPYARQRWVDPETNLPHWISIRRGPETEFPECLQWNGLRARWDAQSSGFGPYEQVRIAKESGGIFFVLPGEEQSLVGRGANDKRKYDFLAMREYSPLLLSRPEYFRERATSEFRETLWQVIARLNPTKNTLLFEKDDPELNIKHEHYKLDLAGFRQEAASQAVRAARAMALTEETIAMLEKIRPLRASESSQRWRAGYDLAIAQLYVFRLRLFQFLLAIDNHVNNFPQPKDSRANEWNIWWNRKTIVPDEAQFGRLKTAFNLTMTRDEYIAMVKAEEKAAVERLQSVIKEHDGTPWARRAQQEINDGFGFVITDRFWDPKYGMPTKLPKL